MVKAVIDTREWDAALQKLAGDTRVSLARSMAVAGGELIRDEAKARVNEGPTGNLERAIYLAYKDARSNTKQVTYSVTWNKSKAPHGHLIEFGHWQPYKVVKINGEWVTTKQKLAQPKWIPAYPFLRPAFEATRQSAVYAMQKRGRERLPELLKGSATHDD